MKLILLFSTLYFYSFEASELPDLRQLELDEVSKANNNNHCLNYIASQ